jgi:predicted transcriptional regulator
MPEDLLRRLDGVANALDRSRSWILLRALALYLDEHEEEILLTAEGLAELRRGEGIDFDDALKEIDAIIDAAEQRRASGT